MAVKLYVGIMGSGKTYEVVSVVILGALRIGRRVVSNIAGLKFDCFVELLLAEGVKREAIGELVHVEHDAVLDPFFWRTDKDREKGVETVIQPGDVVVLDEIWRFWNGFAVKSEDNERCPPRVMNFFRMHRQMTHSKTGVSCDIALITQDVPDVARRVKGVVEETYRMQKLSALGLDQRYRVDIFNRARITRKPMRSLQRTYEAKYFPLYKSHSQAEEGAAGPVEKNIDDRSNILKGWFFRIALPLCVVILGVSIYVVVGFFKGPGGVKTPDAEAKAQGSATAAEPARTARAAPPPASDDKWRAVGWWADDSGVVVMLADGRKTRVLYDPPALQVRTLAVSVGLPEGGFSTLYSGRESTTNTPGVPR